MNQPTVAPGEISRTGDTAARPSGWTFTQLKYIADAIAGGTPDTNNTNYWGSGEEGVPWIAIGDMSKRDTVSTTKKSLTQLGIDSKSLQIGDVGTVLFAMYASVGEVAQLDIPAVWNQAILGLTARARQSTPRFLFYALRAAKDQLPFLYRSNTQNNLNAEQVMNLSILLPDLESQQAVTAFLDRETAKIDALVDKQEQLIATLREDRAATITQAVTKGLDPDVEMKNPDVEWADEIPADWHITPFLRCMEGRVDYRGATPKKVDSGTTLITARNVRPGLIDYAVSEEHVSADDYAEIMRRGLPEIDDILFTMEAPLGHVALVDRTDVALAQRIIKFRADRNIATPTFLMYSVMNSGFQFQLKARATGSTALGLKASKLPELQVAIPSPDEQEAITHFLDDRCAKIDALIDKATEMIETLREYRSALITNAVTGKIDVREAV